MITDYIILNDSSSSYLEHKVKQKLKAGYVPLGGVSVNQVTEYGNSKLFAQAMVKYSEENK